MNNLIKFIINLLLVNSMMFPLLIKAQAISSVSVEQCYTWARENYPLLSQIDIIDKTIAYSLDNAGKGKLPQLNINGQATYQSDVTALPIEIPNMELPTISKDQYKIYGEIYQPLSNFSIIENKKKQIENNGAIEKQRVEIDLYQLNNRINQIYFGTLLIDEKIKQLNIIQVDLDSALVRIRAAIQNGTATLTDEQLLQVERLSLAQQIDENRANQTAFLEMLSVLTGQNITENTLLIKPTAQTVSTTINRPELQLFKLQTQSLLLQQKQNQNSLIPNLGLFLQGGYGRPALNFLSNEFEFYYIGGVKLNWNISSLYTFKNNRQSLNLASQQLSAKRETFLLNTNLTQAQQTAEINKYEQLLKSDQEMINIRESVLATAKVQLENGLITIIDYVRFLNDVNKARQRSLLHETQLLLAQYNLKVTTGN